MRATARVLALTLALSAPAGAAPTAAVAPVTPLVAVPGGSFKSVLPPAPGVDQVKVASFRIDHAPVTNAQFMRFVAARPQWRRGTAPAIFVDGEYLRHWPDARGPSSEQRNQPVVHVSWFAASAYCESRGARLPAWHEWEYVAAASESAADARNDEQWRQRILGWYSRSARGPLPPVAATAANYYGVHDMHGLVWEWVQDLNAMLVSGDNRQQSDPNELKFCGPGALTMEQKENYATLMRIAMLSSMQANYTGTAMGFRCAADMEPQR